MATQESTEGTSVIQSLVQISPSDSCYSDLRGIQWRIHLGILPSSSSIDDLRRVAADSRRGYAALRRRLLVNPHVPTGEIADHSLVMDNPLSQNPDSMWGRFFRNAELEKVLDQDLYRLYPEHDTYFQTSECQSILRRILLLWCLQHPEYGYGQGMHELLAPLLYVLHLDVKCHSQVRNLYKDEFSDKFDGTSLPENNLTHNFKHTDWVIQNEEEKCFHETSENTSNLSDLDPNVRNIILLCDPYGVEGELGILLSERFIEHDVYCMFDALMMGGKPGTVVMADFFSPTTSIGSLTGLPTVIEASYALYHILRTVDSSLYNHLTELGVEPQYFALRWLRVLFGREFLLDDLLVIWDEIFASSWYKFPVAEGDLEPIYGILTSIRGFFISSMAVSMLLHLRSSLLATENATSCLQRLLNFPQNINVKALIVKAKMLESVALHANTSFSSPVSLVRSISLNSGSTSNNLTSPTNQHNLLPESYWEEKWRLIHKADEVQKERTNDPLSRNGKMGSSGKLRFSLSRTESDPSSNKNMNNSKNSAFSTRRNLFDDMSHELHSASHSKKISCNNVLGNQDSVSAEIRKDTESQYQENVSEKNSCLGGYSCLNVTNVCEISSAISDSTTETKYPEHENDSENSSVASNLLVDDESTISEIQSSPASQLELKVHEIEFQKNEQNQIATNSISKEVSSEELECLTDYMGKQMTFSKERKLGSKFQWLWKFGRGGDGNRKLGDTFPPRSINASTSSQSEGCDKTNRINGTVGMMEKIDMVACRSLGRSMLENIQVIETVFEQERDQIGSENFSQNILSNKGQETTLNALKELRNISRLLSEM